MSVHELLVIKSIALSVITCNARLMTNLSGTVMLTPHENHNAQREWNSRRFEKRLF